MSDRHCAYRTHDGFSLIEVLISVVILATGLLALASLQASLTRSSSESKTRGAVAAMLEARMDTLRAAGYTDAQLDPGTATSNCVAGLPVWLCTAKLQANVGALTVTQTTDVWSSTQGGASFTKKLPDDPANDPQYKRVTLSATWKDADADPNPNAPKHSLSTTSQFSSLALTDSPIPTPDPTGSSTAAPVVREDNLLSPGMIPIAMGSGVESAATNPKPVVVGKNNTLIETQYSVLTYTPDAGASRVLQRTENTVIGCRCKYGNQSQLTGIFTQNFRPTYWSGSSYKAPELLDSSRPAIAGPVVPGKNDSPQSDLCTDCCRDHHDATTDTVKFDPFRSGNHSHYLNSNLSAVVAPGGTGEYSESCRVIRVGGFQRVATDARIEHFDFIGTGPAVTDQAPDPAYFDPYKAFVIDYLKNRFTTPSDGVTAEQRYAMTPLKKPALIDIAANDKRYLHGHALMVDHIEAQAQTKIDSILGSCTSTNKIDCILLYLPFTTINLTELAAYAPSNSQVISVVSGGANFNDPSIVQGLVTGRTTATNGQSANANGVVKLSNTALAGVLPIDPDDQSVRPTAQQAYRVGTSSPPAGASFSVTLGLSTPAMSDGTPANDPGVQWKVAAASGACSSATGASPNPYGCATSSPLNVAASVLVSSYNYKSTDFPTVTCTSGNKTITAVTPTPRPICNLYRVSGATASGGNASGWSVTANTGKYSEQTTVNFNLIAPSDGVTVTFTGSGTTVATQASCTLTNNNKAISTVTWADPCL